VPGCQVNEKEKKQTINIIFGIENEHKSIPL